MIISNLDSNPKLIIKYYVNLMYDFNLIKMT